MTQPEAPLYPVALVLAGRPCLVVGGGPVALRKVEGLLRCAAAVTVVAPELEAELVALAEHPAPGTLALVRRAFEPGDLDGVQLVVTATGRPEVDGAVAAGAEAAGLWVNSADDVPHCSFFLPSVHRDGPVTIAVSTAGQSPALARWLRQRLGREAGPHVGQLAVELGAARRAVQAAGGSTEDLDWAALLDGPLPDLVAAGDLEGARALLDAFTGRSA